MKYLFLLIFLSGCNRYDLKMKSHDLQIKRLNHDVDSLLRIDSLRHVHDPLWDM